MGVKSCNVQNDVVVAGLHFDTVDFHPDLGQSFGTYGTY